MKSHSLQLRSFTPVKTHHTLCGLISGLLLLAAGTVNVHAGLILFANRSLWEAAAGGGTGDIFDNLNSGTVNRGTYGIGGTSLSGLFSHGNAQTTIDGTGYARFLLDNATSLTGSLTFNSPITALGYDVNPLGPNSPQAYGRTVLVAIDGNPSSSYILPATEVNGFVGFVSDTPFNSYVFTTAQTEAWHGVDNVVAFSAVPEPGAALFGLAYVGVAALRRHRSA